jgi:hypothetical protein
MTPEQARTIDRREFEAECAAIRQRAYALVQRRPLNPMAAQKRRRAPQPKKPRTANGRPAKLYTVDGITLPLSDWAVRIGMTASALHQRMRKGWTIEEVVKVPPGRHRPGVVDNLPSFSGTGGGSTAQETTEITFSEKANS